MNRYVGFFQSANDGTGYAYFAEADSADEAKENIFNHFAEQYGDDAGEVACYTPQELRDMAERLEHPDIKLDVPVSRRDVPPPPIKEGSFQIVRGSELYPQRQIKKGWKTSLIAADMRAPDVWAFTHLDTGRRVLSANADESAARKIAVSLSQIEGIKSTRRSKVVKAFQEWAEPFSLDGKFKELCRAHSATVHIPDLEQLEI